MTDQVDDFEALMERFDNDLRVIRNRGEPLGEFADEFDNMAKTLRKYEDTKNRLVTKQKSIEASISSKKDKANSAASVIDDIKRKQERLKGEIARFNEERVKLTALVEKANTDMETVTSDVTKLQQLLEIGPGLTDDQKKELKQMKDRKDQLQRERDAYVGQLVNIRMGTKQQMDILVAEQEATVAIGQSIGALKKQHAEIRLETKKAQRRKDRLDGQLQEMTKEVEELKAKIQVESDENVKGAAELEEKENKFKTINSSVGQYVKANDDLLSKMTKLRKDLAARRQVNAALEKQNSEFAKALVARAGETSVIEKDSKKMAKLKVHADKKTGKFEARRAEAEDERAQLQAQIRELQTAIELETKNTESVVRTHSTFERQREIMNKQVRTEEDATKATRDLVAVTENEIKNLENELRAFRDEAVEKRRVIEGMAEERDKYEIEATEKNQNYYAVIEDVKLADMEIVEVQKHIIEVDTKLKSQQNMYEAVRSDRNLYSKNLLEAQEQVVIMKRKFNILTHAIQQLKQEIVTKDQYLVKEHFAHHRVENEIQMLKNDLTRIRKQIQSSEQIINNQVNEIRKLVAIINDAEAEKERQKKEHAAVIAERDTLSVNLVKRNNEVNELYEKIKIVRSTLARGEWKYDETLDDCDYLREEIDEAYQIVEANKKSVAPLQGLKDEVIALENQILKVPYLCVKYRPCCTSISPRVAPVGTMQSDRIVN